MSNNSIPYGKGFRVVADIPVVVTKVYAVDRFLGVNRYRNSDISIPREAVYKLGDREAVSIDFSIGDISM